MATGTWGNARVPSEGARPPANADFEQERAEHERVKRQQREFKLAVEQGQYLPREAVRQASATMLAVLAQSLRSLPDNLERRLSLPPEVIESVSKEVDAALAEISAALKSMTRDG